MWGHHVAAEFTQYLFPGFGVGDGVVQVDQGEIEAAGPVLFVMTLSAVGVDQSRRCARCLRLTQQRQAGKDARK